MANSLAKAGVGVTGGGIVLVTLFFFGVDGASSLLFGLNLTVSNFLFLPSFGTIGVGIVGSELPFETAALRRADLLEDMLWRFISFNGDVKRDGCRLKASESMEAVARSKMWWIDAWLRNLVALRNKGVLVEVFK